MTREEAIEYLTTNCRDYEELNGIHSYFVVAVGRPDIEFYGSEERLKEFDDATVAEQQRILNEIAEELNEMYEEDNFGDAMRTVCGNE
jgi:hypothetical protein